MARVAIIGAGFAGHTAALYLGKALGKKHEITMINRFDFFAFVPSWVWVGTGRMEPEKTLIPLAPVYERAHVRFVHGAARKIYPDDQYVIVENADKNGTTRVDYDYLIIATGPYLNFDATPGLGPEKGYTHSLCSLPHAIKTRDAYLEQVKRMKKGEKVKIVVGTGHPGATCQGAAVEYISNIHKDLVRRGLRDKADLLYLSNEDKFGDFGVHGAYSRYKGKVISSEEFMSAIFKEFGIRWEVQKGVKKVEPGRIYWEDYDGNEGETPFDFAMLVPQFLAHKFEYIGKNGEDVSDQIATPTGFIKVDAIHLRVALREVGEEPRCLAFRVPKPKLPEHFCSRHCLCPTGANFRAAYQPQRIEDRGRPATYRYGLRHHRAYRRPQRNRPNQKRPHVPPGTHDRDVRRLHRFDGQFAVGRRGGCHHRVPRRAGLPPLS